MTSKTHTQVGIELLLAGGITTGGGGVGGVGGLGGMLREAVHELPLCDSLRLPVEPNERTVPLGPTVNHPLACVPGCGLVIDQIQTMVLGGFSPVLITSVAPVGSI